MAGSGTVFKLTPGAGDTWTEAILYSFPSSGGYPYGGVVEDASGALYGTTEFGGASNYGTVYKLTPPATGTRWTYTLLHGFRGGNDGDGPLQGLVFMSNGDLAGTTADGGRNNDGTVFQITP